MIKSKLNAGLHEIKVDRRRKFTGEWKNLECEPK